MSKQRIPESGKRPPPANDVIPPESAHATRVYAQLATARPAPTPVVRRWLKSAPRSLAKLERSAPPVAIPVVTVGDPHSRQQRGERVLDAPARTPALSVEFVSGHSQDTPIALEYDAQAGTARLVVAASPAVLDAPAAAPSALAVWRLNTRA